MASKGKPYRSVSFEDYEILIGKGASENDYLTFRVANPEDVWLHTGGGTPGSHVVIRNPDRVTIPTHVIKHAAQLAAWYSKARNAARVKVEYCEAKHVSKARGAPKGEVMIKKYRSVTVIPSDAPGATEG